MPQASGLPRARLGALLLPLEVAGAERVTGRLGALEACGGLLLREGLADRDGTLREGLADRDGTLRGGLADRDGVLRGGVAVRGWLRLLGTLEVRGRLTVLDRPRLDRDRPSSARGGGLDEGRAEDLGAAWV